MQFQLSRPAFLLRDVSLSLPSATSRAQLKSIISTSISSKELKIPRANRQYILKDINVQINIGDRVALIGHNGAGKSTFLRLIAGIYHCTHGDYIASTPVYPVIYKGFLTHQDLPGLAATKAHYLAHKKNLKGFGEYLSEVIEFSELGDNIYKPLRTYSDGMQARLLFSMITSFNHQCLAMDEGLGTGDKSFISKAQSRLHSFINKAGTLVFASHSVELLRLYCTRGLVFQRGHLVYDGNLEAALKFYDNSLAQNHC